ncbi:hypothetical protein [Streptomyces sp. NPDC001389]|uniref:hypothetical protein n=1 Tax=unclassified Streptomyces TaxID=2593676 RepID=UPI0036B2F3A6
MGRTTSGYDDAPEGAGLVLAFSDYDRLMTTCPKAAQVVLDIIAGPARQAAVLRRRLIGLVQSNDPQIRFEPVGAMPVMWNSDEWADNNRGCAWHPRETVNAHTTVKRWPWIAKRR